MPTFYDIRVIIYQVVVSIVGSNMIYISGKCLNSQIKKLSNKNVCFYHCLVLSVFIIIYCKVKGMNLRLVKSTQLGLGFQTLSC